MRTIVGLALAAALVAAGIGLWSSSNLYAKQSVSLSEHTAAGLSRNAREADVLKLVGYSSTDAGQAVAQFYDELAQSIVLLDRKSLEQRVENLKQHALSADESEGAIRSWPIIRELGF
jgi:hypothetical protein